MEETCLRGDTRSSLGQILSFLCNGEQGGTLVLRRGRSFGGRDAGLCDGSEGVHDRIVVNCALGMNASVAERDGD